MAIKTENRLVRKASGENVGIPDSAKRPLRSDVFEIVTAITGRSITGTQVTTERIPVQVGGDSGSSVEVTLRALDGLHEQATLIVHGQQDVYVDLSDNPTEIPHEDALAAQEIIELLWAEHAEHSS